MGTWIEGTYVKSTGKGVTATLTRSDNTTAYQAGDVIGNATTSIIAFNTGIPVGYQFVILSVLLKIAISALPAGMTTIRLHLYNASPTNIADGTAWALATADVSKYLGYIDISPADLGAALIGQVESVNMVRTLVTTNLYGMLETVGGFTPSAEDVYSISLQCAGV